MTIARVFVVEDEALIAMELCDRLRSLGYDVLGSAAGGEQALRQITETGPDLVLMDISLTGTMTGIDVARALRQRGLDPAIVFLTAFSGHADVAAAGETEGAGYLVKPFNEQELHATLQVAHARRLADRERGRRLEEHRVEEALLRRAEKDQSLGRMAGAVAHSVNNALGGVLGLIGLARESVAEPDECAAYLDAGATELQRVVKLAQVLQQIARGRPTRPTALELGRLCREAAPLLEALMPGSTRLTFEVPGDGPVARADLDTLREALVQLVTNAAEAMAGRGGEITIGVGSVEGEELRCVPTWPASWNPAGARWACLGVRDEGPGIADGELDRIFEPFYSTKLLGRGVGLALVLSTARALGGGVCVQTGPTGTTIRICLSMADAA